MEQRRFAALCAAVLCFWLFALAFGTAQGMGWHLLAAPAAQTAASQPAEAEWLLPAAAQPGAFPPLPGGHSGGAGERAGAL